MKCLEREKLFAFTQGMLEGSEAENARAHLAECAACRRVAEDYRRLEGVLDEWKAVEPSPWFDARVRQAVAVSAAAAPATRAGWVRWLVPAAALAAVAVAASLLWVRAHRSTQTLQPVAQQPAQQVPPTPAPRPRQEMAQAPGQKTAAPKNRQVLRNVQDELSGEGETAEDYDMLANFEVLSELAPAEKKVVN